MLSGSTSYPTLHISSPVSNTLKFFLTRKFILQNNFNETFADLSCTFGGARAESCTNFVDRSGRRIHDMSVKGHEKC